MPLATFLKFYVYHAALECDTITVVKWPWHANLTDHIVMPLEQKNFLVSGNLC